MVVRGKEGSDAQHHVVVAVGIRADDHVAIVVALQIGDLAQQGDCLVAGGEAVGLPCGVDGILLDLVALGGIIRAMQDLMFEAFQRGRTD